MIGFLVAALSILLIHRNPSVSPWFALLVNIYPILETLFTIWRRLVNKGSNPSISDGVHFHSLIYRRMMRWTIPKSHGMHHHYLGNAKTSPYLWAISSLGTVPAILFWQSTAILMVCSLVFTLVYIYLYRRVVRFHRPRWLSPFRRDR